MPCRACSDCMCAETTTVDLAGEDDDGESAAAAATSERAFTAGAKQRTSTSSTRADRSDRKRFGTAALGGAKSAPAEAAGGSVSLPALPIASSTATAG